MKYAYTALFPPSEYQYSLFYIKWGGIGGGRGYIRGVVLSQVMSLHSLVMPLSKGGLKFL
jgi:hypothetical protein